MGQTEAEKTELIRQVGENNYQSWFARELPQHQVTISSFLMGKYPITQAQYEQIMGTNPSHFQGLNRPIECVSWNDAVEFCQKLWQETSREYRLPTEAEWEYACGAGAQTPFYFGETITTDLTNYRGTDSEWNRQVVLGNYGKGSKGEYRQSTTDVGKFPPNAFGLYDMHGNVWEWCADSWHQNYANKPQELKFRGNDIWLFGDESVRPLRGGSWNYYPIFCRRAFRTCNHPVKHYGSLGFRVVCSVPTELS
jgi:formylglycine-generating enzyme required for sulfatase activity